LERRKLDADRGRFEHALQREERTENLRQLKDRFHKWMSAEYSWKPDGIATLDPLLDRVLAAIGNEALATAARGGVLIEHAFLKAWGAVAKARNTQQARLDDAQAREDLGQRWRGIVTDAVRANPTPPGTPQDPARSG
jgi:hypothetical protein